MKLTKLSLTNFRSFKQTQTIDFAPTTLLFGPNSAGKSTVLMALFYVQHILEHGDCDPHYISALGHKFIGGFENLVNGRDLTKEIKIKVEFSKSGIGSTYYDPSLFDEVADGLELICAGMPEVMLESELIAVEFVIRYSQLNKSAYVEQYCVWLNDEFVAQVQSDSGMKIRQITSVNFEHPLLTNQNDDSRFSEELSRLPIAVDGVCGALPQLGRPLEVDFSADSIFDNIYANAIYSEIVVSPLDNLLALLKASACIGPIRTIPDQQFHPNASPSQGDWYSGLAAWDRFYRPEYAFTHDYNTWIDKRLKLGYQLVVKVEQGANRYVIPHSSDAMSSLLAVQDAIGVNQVRLTLESEQLEVNGGTPIDLNLVSKLPFTFTAKSGTELNFNISLEGESTKTEIKVHTDEVYRAGELYKQREVVLWDLSNNIPVSASDIGVGISQVFPLIVAGLTQERGVVSCEQPELHVHPRIQVELGDFLTQSNDKVNYLIETHSEHIILRILRRIRETTDNELPDDIKPVYTKDVSIMYIESGEDGVVAKRIEIDDDGEFVTRWPKGFFGERREELF